LFTCYYPSFIRVDTFLAASAFRIPVSSLESLIYQAATGHRFRGLKTNNLKNRRSNISQRPFRTYPSIAEFFTGNNKRDAVSGAGRSDRAAR
ncbi:hypothetical protein OFM36_30785, partial [Escherichia coli]|nr:hypothetical protein [Escherichia coli]